MDDRDHFSGGGRHGPGSAEEVDGLVGVEASLAVEGQMEVEEFGGDGRAEL
jgi:hypothetical protein